MELLKKYWRELIIVLLIIFLLVDCNPQESTKVTVKDVEVEVPGSEGVFGDPKEQTELPSKGKDSIVIKKETIYSTHPLDKVLAEKLKNAKDSVEILKIAIEAIQERENITDFSNDKLDLKVHTLVQGQLKDIKVDYKIHPQKVIVQEKTVEKTVLVKDNFGTIILGKYNHALDPTNPSSLEVGAGVRIKKVSILGTVNTNKQVGIGAILEL